MAEGYDTNRFQSSIDHDFTCAICLGVLKNPMQCKNNEHYFCSSCIKEHLEKTSLSCPTCNDKLTVETLRKAPRIVADYVSRLKINCEYAAKGCDAVLELGALQRHLQNCDFVPVNCSNEGCLEEVCKRDVKHHELELCQFKTATCDDCGEKIPHHKYDAHGCVLRRDLDEVKKDLAEMKSTQHKMMSEMRQGMQRMTTAIESLEKSCRNVSNVVNAMSSDIVVIGGLDLTHQAYSYVERFDLSNQTWTLMPELKQARSFSAAVLFENQLLVCGGSTKGYIDEPTDSIEVLDMNGTHTEWQRFSVDLPIKVLGHKCVVYENRLLIFGGRTEKGEALDTIYELLLVPPYSSKLLCRMKKKRVFHGAELFEDKVLIASGAGTKTDVEIFDITRNECVEMPPLPFPLRAMVTVRRDDTMLLIGGNDKEDKSDVHLIKKDEKVGASEATLSQMLKNYPFSYGLKIEQVYEAGSVFSPDVLDITEENILSKFIQGIANVASVSLAIGYPTVASVPYSVVNGFKNVLAIALETDITFSAVERLKAYMADPSAFAAAAPAAGGGGGGEDEAEKAEEKKEEDEEDESDDDMGFGLFD